MRDSVHDRALGKWPSILMQLGVSPTFLRNIHGPCPMCGGKDRWRFDNKDSRGTYFCTGCGAGSGVDLVMGFKNCTYMEAVKHIESVIGGAPLAVKRELDGATDITAQKNAMRQLWLRSLPLTGQDIASRYFAQRGIALEEWPPCIRWAIGQPYWLDREMIGYFPVMLARFVAPDERSANIQRTYLREPGYKAAVPGAARKMMAGPIPVGGAVRLRPAAEIMGVAEGVETALAASLQHDLAGKEIIGGGALPVWATLSTAGLLRFQPPPECKKLLIFGDRDENFAGHAAAGALANRLRTQRGEQRIECEDRMAASGVPDQPYLANKRDWNDVLMAKRLPALRLVK